MSLIIIDSFPGQVIKIGGVCHTFVGTTTEPTTGETAGDVFASCDDCLNPTPTPTVTPTVTPTLTLTPTKMVYSCSTLTSYTGTDLRNGFCAINGSYVYVGGGYNDSSAALKQWYRYDIAGNSWTDKTDYAGSATYGGVAATDGGNLIFAGLGSGGGGKQWYAYSISGNSWASKTAHGVARYGGTAVYGGDGNIYVGMGSDASFYKDWWAYSIANDTWTQKTDFPGVARLYPFGVYYAGTGLIYVGSGKASNGTYPTDFYAYNPATNTWSSALATLSGRYVSVAAAGTGFIYMAGGNNGSWLNDVTRYDIAQNAWSSAGNTCFGSRGSAAGMGCFLSGNWYHGMGYDGTNTKSWYKFIE